VLLGFALACVLAAQIQVLFAFGLPQLAASPLAALDIVAMTATHFAVFAAPFALVVAAIGEWLSIRGWLYYAGAGIAIAAAGFMAQYSSETSGAPSILNIYAAKAFLTPGFLAGFFYWVLAGRNAGEGAKSRRPNVALDGN
jgi:hypothetical protein